MVIHINDTTPSQMIEDDFDIKKKVEEVLTESGFSEQRAAKMDVDDLLKCVNNSRTAVTIAVQSDIASQTSISIP